MRDVLNILTVPMEANGMALLLARIARELGGLHLAYFGDIPEEMAGYFAGSVLYRLPDRRRDTRPYLAELAKLVKEKGYTAVHVHGNSATMALDLAACRRGGATRRIAQGHNTGAVYARTEKLLRPLFYSLVTDRTACSEAAGEFLYAKRSFTVLPVPVDAESFAYDPTARELLRRGYGVEDDTILIGTAGTMTEQKNQALLIRMLAGLDKRYRLFIAGEGPEREKLEQLARELNVEERVYMPGHLKDMWAVYGALDVFALPSLREGLPTCVLEAVCSGLTCLVSDSVTRECGVSDKVRFLPANEEAFARAAEKIVPRERERASRHGIERVRETGHSIETAAQRYREFWYGAE